MTNHTPAPWDDNDVYGNIWHENERRRTPVVEGSGNGLAFNNAYDRDLILAAPDMYEALEDALEYLDGNETLTIYWTVFDALQKARGEQQ